MRRREFITGVGANVALPVLATAQETRRIAILSGFTDDRQEANQIGVLKKTLQELGWQEGRNLQIDYRRTGNVETLRSLASEMLASSPQVIVAMPTPALAAVQRATKSIPTIFAFVSEPVEGGFVQSLARPGGNITGFTAFEYSIGSKWVEILKEIYPALSRVLVLLFQENYTSRGLLAEIERAGRSFGMTTIAAPVKNSSDIERVIETFGPAANGGVIAVPHPVLTNNMKLVFSLATKNRLPGMYPFRQYTENGGLASYGSIESEMFRQIAVVVDRVLKGQSPADLPVQNPTKFELVINVHAARSIGLVVPPALLARANEVIE
jgi:putative ABC transport system substrate-binding protein